MPENKRREQQVERMRESLDERAQRARAQAEERSVRAADRPPDEMSVRAKSSGHKKKTADKWNQ
jgi:hypothetical protein